MRYDLVYTRRAARDIEALDTLTKLRIGERIRELEEDPVRKSRKLSHAEIGTYRFRIGDYRIVFDLEGHRVVILRVGHRREIYR